MTTFFRARALRPLVFAPIVLTACAVEGDSETATSSDAIAACPSPNLAANTAIGCGGDPGDGAGVCFSNTSARPTASARYVCNATAKDIFGRPLAGKTV